jgi:hypothetical protein
MSKTHENVTNLPALNLPEDREKVVFTRKISRSGQDKILLFTIPASVQPLLEFGKVYKITMEEL